jgi:asparagine synthase (glutamine-hydrolysing)
MESFMCGIAGYYDMRSKSDSRAVVMHMTDALHHRGPDDSGVWSDAAVGIVLGHRRLSILDLSPAGHQPMTSPDGRFVIAFNGEIYNFAEIKSELETSVPIQWRSTSDTEVMLEAFSRWGIEKSVKRFAGMFAFAVWDRQERALWLVRDRLGEKPLYYGLMNGCFLFGSELKALQRHPKWRGEIDRNALALYFRYSYIPAPYTIFCGMKKLLPGTILHLSEKKFTAGDIPEPVPYWSALEVIESGRRRPFVGSSSEAVAGLDRVLKDTIRQEMVSDVPLGAFLSGGIDSSTIVSLMQAQSAMPVRTFTIGFHEQDYNEADNAKAVARHLRTDHTELYVTPADAMALIPRLPTIFDEPFSDVSQIPMLLVAEMTRRHVTVSLSGDGGDELFGGYNRYFFADRIWRSMSPLPYSLRKAIAALMMAPSSSQWDRVHSMLGPLIPNRFQQRQVGDKIHKMAPLLSLESRAMLYKRLVSHWNEPECLVKNSQEPMTIINGNNGKSPFSFTEQMMYLDAVTYLPDDILVKVDRASMAVSLESRAPFLDHRVFEFAWTLPLEMKVRNSKGKLILKKLLEKYVPREFIDRPKMGFGVPIDSWLRGPLRGWAEELLDKKRIDREGYLHSAPIREKWHEHLSGKRNWQYHIWGVLMFQAWLEGQKNISHVADAHD